MTQDTMLSLRRWRLGLKAIKSRSRADKHAVTVCESVFVTFALCAAVSDYKHKVKPKAEKKTSFTSKNK